MTSFALCRSLAKPLAPLCESPAEGAQATDGGQDKRDSLRLCPAVVLSLLVNMFAQAALSAHSLSSAASHCLNWLISTSCVDAHDR